MRSPLRPLAPALAATLGLSCAFPLPPDAEALRQTELTRKEQNSQGPRAKKPLPPAAGTTAEGGLEVRDGQVEEPSASEQIRLFE